MIANPKRVEVLTGNRAIGLAAHAVYLVESIASDGEHGARLTLARVSGSASSKARVVVWVRYAKHMEREIFNASRGDGVNKVKLYVRARKAA